MKKVVYLSMVFLSFLLVLTGCGKKATTIDGKMEDLIAKLYDGIDENDLPMYLENITLTDESLSNYIGTSDIKWKEAIASESSVGSIAHSVVLIRMDDKATSKDIEEAKNKIKESVDPAKWICTEAEKVYVESNNNLIVVIMTFEDIADSIKDNFLKLK